MTADASNELQAAIVAKLKATAAVTALVGTRIYDRKPPDPSFPYITFGPEQELPGDFDCIDAADIVVQIDIWSRDVGYKQAKSIAGAVQKALKDATLTLTDNAFVYIALESRRIFMDVDGLTVHGVVTLQAGVEKN